ncbi:MAG: class I SAM-dependent methyltransferase [Candidatus Margulisiibacteriota bacterium]|jgi:SAM-dependent methyltransferase
MRKVYRDKNNPDYWEKRWEDSGVDNDEFKNFDIYPIKYTNMVVTAKNQKILEAGCGAGRVYFHYKNLGYDIHGIEYSKIAVKNILEKDKSAKVQHGSITELPYADNSFDVLLALGLYHNLEDEKDLEKSFSETARVLKTGGKLLASVRFDSFENNLIEYIVHKRNENKTYDQFHRVHFDIASLDKYLSDNKLKRTKLMYARNVSFLFKFDFFRSKQMKSNAFKESEARSKGFKLNWLGTNLDKFLHKFFPKIFSNIIIIIAEKV